MLKEIKNDYDKIREKMTQKIQELNQQITQIKKQIQIIEQNNLSDQQNQTIQK